MNQPTSGRARFGLLLDGLTLLVLCGAIGLYITNRRTSATPAPPIARSLDSAFAPFPVLDSAGHTSLLKPEGRARGMLLFVFKSDCPACALQKQEWIRLAQLAREKAVDVFALTLEELNPQVREYFAGAVVARRIADPAAALTSLQITVVPATILVTDRGRIAFHAAGVLDSLRTRALEGML